MLDPNIKNIKCFVDNLFIILNLLDNSVLVFTKKGILNLYRGIISLGDDDE